MFRTLIAICKELICSLTHAPQWWRPVYLTDEQHRALRPDHYICRTCGIRWRSDGDGGAIPLRCESKRKGKT